MPRPSWSKWVPPLVAGAIIASTSAGTACDCGGREVLASDETHLEAQIGEAIFAGPGTYEHIHEGWREGGGGNHFVPACKPPDERHEVRAVLELQGDLELDGHYQDLLDFYLILNAEDEDAEERAHTVFDELAVEGCADSNGHRLAVRVHGGDFEPAFRVVYFFPERAMIADVTEDTAVTNTCEEALAAAPAGREAWLVGAVSRCAPHAVELSIVTSRALDALLACELTADHTAPERVDALTEAIGRGAEGEPDLEAMLFAYLTPTESEDEPGAFSIPSDVLRAESAGALLAATPTDARRLEFARAVADACAVVEDTFACAGAITFAADLVHDLEDEALCDALAIDLAATVSMDASPDPDRILGAFRDLRSCAGGEARATMARAVFEVSREIRPLVAAYDRPGCAADAFDGGQCASPALVSADVLATDCDAEHTHGMWALVEATTEGFYTPQTVGAEPHLEAQLAGAMRVLSACAPEARYRQAATLLAGADESRKRAIERAAPPP